MSANFVATLLTGSLFLASLTDGGILPTASTKLEAAKPAAVADDEPQIKDIRKEFQRINAARLSKRVVSFACGEEYPQGTATFHTEKGRTVKIVVDFSFMGDYASAAEYCYLNGALIFSYTVSVGGTANGAAQKTEKRLYVSNNKTIRQLENQRAVPCETCTFGKASLEYRILAARNADEVRRALCD